MQSQFISRLLICVWLTAFSRQVTAQEPDAGTKVKIAKRNQLQEQAMKLAQQGKLADAAQKAEEVYKLEETIFGSAHSELLGTLGFLCRIAKASQNETEIIGYRKRQQVVAENLYGKDDYRTHDAARDVNDAKQRAAFTPDQMSKLARADSLYSQMMQSYQYGQHKDGVRAATECLALRKQVLGDTNPDYASSLNNLAQLYHSMSDFPRAEPLYREAMAIREKVLGKKHPSYATSLNNLASLYSSMNDYPQAEPLYREAMAIREKVLGKEHPSYATSLNNLASLYYSISDYARAEPLYREAMSIDAKVLGKEHPSYANSLNNLAGVYGMIGDYPRAQELSCEAIVIQEKVLGKEHPDYATSLNNLALLYKDMGDYARAEPLYREAMSIDAKVLGKKHPSYATSLNNLASLYSSMSDYPRAEPLYSEAIVIQAKVLGKEHPSYATSLSNLAFLYNKMGDFRRAETLYREAVEITLANLERTSDVQSERQQVLMGESVRFQLDNYLSLATREPKFQEQAYAALLRWKGSVWQRQLRQQALHDQPSLQPRFVALQDASSKLSTLILNPPADAKQRDAWKQRLEELTDQREKLQRDLSLASIEFRQSKQTVTPEQLRQSLPEESLLIDFLEFWYFSPADEEQQTKDAWERRLLVHLVCAGETVRAIDLGPVETLNSLIQTWRKDLGQSRDAVDAAQELRRRIWTPIESQLSGINTVYVSPDGLLGQFPLAALPGKRPGSYLLEELAIIQLPVPQGLPAMAKQTELKSSTENDRFCLVGGVDYEKVSTGESSSSQNADSNTDSVPSGPLSLAARGGQWQAFNALPGTAAEIDTIQSLVRQYRPTAQTTILRGDVASEAAFAKTASQHRFLHVATHGFFAPESVQNALTASKPDANGMLGLDNDRAPRIVGQHPDLLSGLVFAGANQDPTAGAEDGILTAAEVQKLDLRSVELAILSACETGLGRTAGGEGIIGLQRAFQLAGAKTTITSLWQVDDAATQALMVEFYRNLFDKKLSKLESLRQAQIWMLNNPEAIEGRDLTTRGTVRETKALTVEANAISNTPARSLPAYWAAFQLSGDPR